MFDDADVHTSVVIFQAEKDAKARSENPVLTNADLSEEFISASSGFSRTKQKRFLGLEDKPVSSNHRCKARNIFRSCAAAGWKNYSSRAF